MGETMKSLHESIAVACVVLASVLVLTGCAGEAPSNDLTLRDTKSPAQLLRNSVASRIDEALIASAGDSVDQSVACKTEKEDPEGLQRYWQSKVTLALVGESAKDVDLVIDAVATAMTAEGWKLASLGGSSVIHTRYLSNDTSSTIELSAISTDEDAKRVESTELENASIVVDVHGPCVATEGAASDEVKSLERQE